MLSQKTIDDLITQAQRTTWQEQCEEKGDVIDDFAGGNVNDAYDGGERDGQTNLARDILAELNIKWD